MNISATKLLLSFLCAVLVTALIFAVMDTMVRSDPTLVRLDHSQTMIDFIRSKQDSKARTKQREHKQPPKPNKPPPIQQPVAQTPMTLTELALNMATPINPDLSLADNSLIGDAAVGMGLGDGDVIPLLRMPAQYPAKAKRRKIEGVVKASLKVSAQGTVDDVDIISAEPQGYFERSAIRALYKYKFKPRVVDGVAQPQVVTQTLEFVLE